MLIIKPGRKLIDEESNTVYIIRSIKAEEVILVSEDGEASMLLQKDRRIQLILRGLNPFAIDWHKMERPVVSGNVIMS